MSRSRRGSSRRARAPERRARRRSSARGRRTSLRSPRAAGPHRGAEGQQRHVLARVVGAGRNVGSLPWSAVMNSDVAGPERRQERGHARVELFERARVTGDVAAVAVHHVEVDEVDEQAGRAARAPSPRASAAARRRCPRCGSPRRCRAWRRCRRSCRRRPPAAPPPRRFAQWSARRHERVVAPVVRALEALAPPLRATNGRAITRPMCWRRQIARAFSQMRTAPAAARSPRAPRSAAR